MKNIATYVELALVGLALYSGYKGFEIYMQYSNFTRYNPKVEAMAGAIERTDYINRVGDAKIAEVKAQMEELEKINRFYLPIKVGRRCE